MASNNKVCVNIDQTDPEHGGFTDAEKLQARKNTGAAGVLSLAPSFESRAPNYKWDAEEVCAYGGGVWQFDANHSGAWTGADAHEISIIDLLRNQFDVELHENVLDYSDDWIDISNEFTLFSGCSVYTANDVMGNVSDLHIKFSAKRKWVYFDCAVTARLLRDTKIEKSDSWVPFLRYDGNRIKLPIDGGLFRQNDLTFPIDVSRGQTLFLMCASNTGTTDLCQISYTTRADPLLNGIACKKFIDSGDESYGFLIGQTLWRVDTP